MADVLFLVVVVVFFVLAGLYVRACEAIVGPDVSGSADEPAAEETVRT